MAITHVVPETVIPAKELLVHRRELYVVWKDDDEKLNLVEFGVERSDGTKLTFKADGDQLDEPLAALGGVTLRQFFDRIGQGLLSVDPTPYTDDAVAKRAEEKRLAAEKVVAETVPSEE